MSYSIAFCVSLADHKTIIHKKTKAFSYITHLTYRYIKITIICLCSLYGENLKGVDCGDEVAAWLSRLTEMPNLRLLYHADEKTQRGPVKRNLRFATYRGSHTVRQLTKHTHTYLTSYWYG